MTFIQGIIGILTVLNVLLCGGVFKLWSLWRSARKDEVNEINAARIEILTNLRQDLTLVRERVETLEKELRTLRDEYHLTAKERDRLSRELEEAIDSISDLEDKWKKERAEKVQALLELEKSRREIARLMELYEQGVPAPGGRTVFVPVSPSSPFPPSHPTPVAPITSALPMTPTPLNPEDSLEIRK